MLWFVLADVCRALGLGQFRTERLDGDVIRNQPMPDQLGRTQNTIVVSEAGMYEVVIRSDKPQRVFVELTPLPQSDDRT